MKISGGRVDIRIKNKNTVNGNDIIIENKIKANDQWAQLARIRESYGNSIIVYLTPLGKSASSYSLNNKLGENDYIKLSYKDDIRKWLYQCLCFLQNENCKLCKKEKNKFDIL